MNTAISPSSNLIRAALVLLLMAGFYYPAYTWLVLSDWGRADYSYGYMIPLVIAYLLYEKRWEIFSTPAAPGWLGLSLFLPGLFLYWIGEFAGEYFTLYLSSWLVLAGVVWLNLGIRKLKTIAFPILLMLTMFPPPHFLSDKITLELKMISSQLGVAMIHAFGMSAFRDGNVIDLGFTQLQVVDACSGLRYLFPLVVMALILAYFYRGSAWKKFVIVIASVPLTIVTNALRIALTAVLYRTFGASVAEGFFHSFGGWFIFMFSLGALLFLMWALSGFGPFGSLMQFGRSPQKEQNKEAKDQARPFSLKSLLSPPQFLVAVVLLGATLAVSHAVEFREKIPMARSFAGFPLELGTWKGKRQTMEQKFIDTLDLSDYVMLNYQGKDGKSVDFYTAFYESQRKGESIHSPETCLPGSGWEFKKAGAVELPLKDRRGNPMRVNKAVMIKGDFRQLSYFWFPQRDRVLTSAWELKWYNFWDALTRQRTDGALVRLITPIYTGEDLAEADQRLLAFTREIVPVLNEFLPQ
ncbi:MAG: VPLPA-CTERM-specific exosortase XrtD [Desulfobacteraceae bacterium]|nr:MAG: VPLPA-CTERM-specific exosortase XrtD [Desulfobacteraceae bacterium]